MTRFNLMEKVKRQQLIINKLQRIAKGIPQKQKGNKK